MGVTFKGTLLLFRDAQHPDLEGQYFSKDTNFGEIEGKTVPVTFGQDRVPIGSAVLWKTDEGIGFGGKLKDDLPSVMVQQFIYYRDSDALRGAAVAISGVVVRDDGGIIEWPLSSVYLTTNPVDPELPSICKHDGSFKGETTPVQQGKPDSYFVPFAESAFNAYRRMAEEMTYDGRPIPEWLDLGERVQGLWVAAVKDVMRKLGVRDDAGLYVSPVE